MHDGTSPRVDFSGETLRDIRFLDAVARYVTLRRQLGEWTPRTASAQRTTLTRFAGCLPPKRQRVGQVRRADIEQWLADQAVSPNTLRAYLSTLRAFFRWLVEQGQVVADPTVGIRGPRKVATPPRHLSREQVGRLLELADNRARVMILLGVQEGLRVGEIAALDVADIDPDGLVVVRHGKGDRHRLVPLSAETEQAIGAYLHEAPAALSDPLLRPLDGTRRRLAVATIRRLVTDLMWCAGVKTQRGVISTHSLRHTCANDVLDHGADLRDVQELLGHSNLNTTAIYARRRAALGRLKDAADGRRYAV